MFCALIVSAVFISSKAAIGTNGLSLFTNSVSVETVEATKFCTGDGETNCVTDFSTIDTDTTLNESTVESYIGNDINTNYVPRDNGTKLITGSIYDNGNMIGVDNSTRGDSQVTVALLLIYQTKLTPLLQQMLGIVIIDGT